MTDRAVVSSKHVQGTHIGLAALLERYPDLAEVSFSQLKSLVKPGKIQITGLGPGLSVGVFERDSMEPLFQEQVTLDKGDVLELVKELQEGEAINLIIRVRGKTDGVMIKPFETRATLDAGDGLLIETVLVPDDVYVSS